MIQPIIIIDEAGDEIQIRRTSITDIGNVEEENYYRRYLWDTIGIDD